MGKYIGAGLGILISIVLLSFVLGFISTGGDYVTYRFWAPKQANAERVVFQNTQSFVQGKIQYLTRLELQYKTATGDEKEGLRTLILTEASTIDESKLPPQLYGFIAELGEERPGAGPITITPPIRQLK